MGRAPVGNGVLMPQYQKSSTAGTPGVVGPVAAGIAIGGVPKNHRAVKAATIATQRAKPKSTKYCARFVADALQGAGYKFTRQNSAYQYASGPLSSAGFTRIQNNGKYQIGDVMVWGAHGVGSSGGATHGHIQIFNGRNWVSDFIQQNMRPGSSYSGVTPTLWRDSTLIGKTVTGSVPAKGVTPSADQAKASTTDNKSPEAKRPATAPKAQIAHTGTSGPVTTLPPSARPAPARPTQSSTSAPATDNAFNTSNQNISKASTQATAAQETILKEQLKVQKSMLKTLGEIRDRLPPVGSSNKSNSPPPPPQSLGELGGSRNQPINMDIKH